MLLPEDFTFSQSSLQDYLDCPRRFELRYSLKVECPALQGEPYLELERKAEAGRRFHELVFQHQLGLATSDLLESITDQELNRWMENYLQSEFPQQLPTQRYLEFTLQSSFAGKRVTAQFDLIAVDPGNQLTIVDWKTSEKRTRSSAIALKIQSRLYPVLAVLAGQSINSSQAVSAHQIQMIYWFPNFPDDPEIITYSVARFEKDIEFLSALIQNICALNPGEFPLTSDEKRCGFCNYRSVCSRGVTAGNLAEYDDFDLPGAGIDINQIEEIEF
jgi:CRISPR/Cas system-associated exonuclease Cas4 (RecB family)